MPAKTQREQANKVKSTLMDRNSEKMKVHIKEAQLIRPAQETPNHYLRTTVLDRVMPTVYGRSVCFYERPKTESSSSSEVSSMMEALSKVLVPFYPVAGRLVRDKNGEFDIHCNGEGVMLIEAEASCAMDEVVRTQSNSMLLQLIPYVDYRKDPSFYPLVMTQMTRFKCGGICVGGMSHHILADGTATGLFTKSWAEVTRGSPISIPPVLDRTLIDNGIPVSPTFHHPEYNRPPSMANNPTRKPGATVSTAVIEISPDQMKTLREKSSMKADGSVSTAKYSRFEILAAHIWRCACVARGLPSDQRSQVEIAIDGRSKMNPKIPAGYLGNVVFNSTPNAFSGEVQSEPLNDTVERIRKSFDGMDDKYLKSALAYLKRQPDLKGARRAAYYFSCPNLTISNLSNMPIYEADYGWGRPVLFRPVNAMTDGIIYILPSPRNDGTLMAIVHLETNHLQIFKKCFNEIFLQPQDFRRSMY